MEIKDLKKHEKNPRRISKDQFKRLQDSLEKYGDLGGVIFNVKNNKLVGGHMRVESFSTKNASIEYTSKLEKPDNQGTTAIGFVVINGQKYSYREVSWDDDETHEAAMLIANRAGGDWDFDMLANEWDKDFLVDVAGFEDKDFFGKDDENVTELEPTEGDDDVPESSPEISVKGDLYEINNHRLLCGDSLVVTDVEKLMAGKKANTCFTDPPYGYSYKSNHQSKHDVLENDDVILDFIPILFSFMSENSALFLCTSHQVIEKWKPLVDSTFKYKNMIVWKKNNWSMGDLKGAFAGQHELVIFAHKGSVDLQGGRDTDVWEFDRVPPKLHPTMKPVELITKAINKINGDLVCDLFLGSGSTMIACEKTNKKCYGIEIDPKYCDTIIKRYIEFCKKNGKDYSVKRNGEECKDFD